MRTETTSPPGLAVAPASASAATAAPSAARLRAGLGRARRWVVGAGRATRLALLAIVGGGAVALAYWAIPLDRDETLWLYDGRRFSPAAAEAIQKALAVEGIAFQADAGHRVGVAGSTWPKAMVALEKHGAGRPSLDAIDKAYQNSSSLLEGPAERADRLRYYDEQRLRAIIEGYEGVRSADVRINRAATTRGGMARAVSPASGSVVLDTDRKPPLKTILAIRTLLSTQVPDLRPDAVTISDQSGKFYLMAGDHSVASAAESGARGEELRDALVENLSPSIRGIDVVVTVEPVPMPMPVAAPIPPTPAPVVPAEETKANTPIGLDDGPPSGTEFEPVDAAKPAPAPPAPAPSPTPAPGPCKANVWVKVPRSYYLQIYRDNAPGRQPSPEDLEPYRLKTHRLIEDAVAILLPTAERGRVLISTVVDDAGAGGPLVVPAGGDGRRLSWPAWGPPAAIGATAGLVVALVFGAGLGLLARRRPAGRPSRSELRSGLSVDAPSGAVPGPSERVRDLVRRDPGAAAGVLQRWIGQGEGEADG